MTRLPAEWEPQAALLLAWPHADSDWGPVLGAVEAEYRQLALAAGARQRLLIIARDGAHQRHIKALLGDGIPPPRFARLALDDTWARDFGPLTVWRDGRRVLLDFRFNAWGGRYPYRRDDGACRSAHGQGLFGDLPLESVPWVLEGGAIDSDGTGTLLTTRSVLLDRRRNPDADPDTMARRLRHALGAQRILWLTGRPLAGDDTGGHVDTLARFCAPGRIAYSQSPGPGHPDHAPLAQLEGELLALRDAAGRPYRLVPLPLPAPRFGADGAPLPANYANFVLVNGAVLVPAYGDPADAVARERLAACFPDREALSLPAAALIGQRGGPHCAVMQIPAPPGAAGAMEM